MTALLGVPEDLQPSASRALAVMASVARDPRAGWPTGEIAARLDVAPWSAERDAIQSAIFAMKRAGLVAHFPFTPGEPIRWYLTARGEEAARVAS